MLRARSGRAGRASASRPTSSSRPGRCRCRRTSAATARAAGRSRRGPRSWPGCRASAARRLDRRGGGRWHRGPRASTPVSCQRASHVGAVSGMSFCQKPGRGGAVREALEVERPIPEVRQHRRRDQREVADQLALRDRRLGVGRRPGAAVEQRLVEVRQLQLAATDRQTPSLPSASSASSSSAVGRRRTRECRGRRGRLRRPWSASALCRLRGVSTTSWRSTLRSSHGIGSWSSMTLGRLGLGGLGFRGRRRRGDRGLLRTTVLRVAARLDALERRLANDARRASSHRSRPGSRARAGPSVTSLRSPPHRPR